MTKRPVSSPLLEKMPPRKYTPLVRVGSQDLHIQTQLPPETPPLDATQFEELWHDVRTASTPGTDPTEDSNDVATSDPKGGANRDNKRKVKTGDRDTEFLSTSLKDLYYCIRHNPDTSQSEIDNLDNYLPFKIVMDTRDQYQDCVRLGHNQAGCKALDEGLEKLTKKLKNEAHVDSNPWRIGMAEILIDQGRKQEARAVLSKCESGTRGEETVLVERHHKRRRTGADDEYKEMQKMFQDVESELDLNLRAEAWGKAREVAKTLYNIDPSYFDLNEPMDRFTKCRRLLQLGLLKEIEAGEVVEINKRSRCLQEALEIYNHGCFATELYHEFFDHYEAKVYGFDHSDCANIFFSAARICTIFDKEGLLDEQSLHIPPTQFRCKGPDLTGQDWRHQALHFLEQGRSRALLDSIVRGAVVPSMQRRLIQRTVVNDMTIVADAAVRSIKKRVSLVSMSATPKAESVSESIARLDSFRGSIIPALRRDAKTSASTTESGISSPSSNQSRNIGKEQLQIQTSNLEGSTVSSLSNSPATALTPLQTEEELLADMKVQMRWRKALLYALTKVNPTLDATLEAALPTIGKFGGIEKMRASIPPDTIVVEYALASTTPCGVMTIVVASDSVKAALWKEMNAIDIQNCIADLRASMSSSNMGMRESRPPAPERRASTTSREKLDAILRDAVVTPVKQHLQGKKRLIIVPSGDLAHVPWTMFFDLPITVVPSLSIWSRLQSQANAANSQNPKISIVSNAPEDKDKAKNDMPSLRDIPFSRIEALYIARRHDQSPFLADDEDRKAFEALAKGTQILHICAHSTFDPEAPMSSSIQLFKEPLTMLDWHKLSIKADLVVFSSCLSGISKAYDSGSTIGFAHTLLGTGTKAFIGSLWPVDDTATLLLMIMFYNELRRPLPAADALYEAQKRMRALTEADLHDLIDLLEEIAIDNRTDEFVINPDHYINELRQLKAEELAEDRYWAAFVLTGYGSKIIYPTNE
ncbi:hypothetical protein K469DRAFT_689149 [Zopfia rhizophila CBS 207.26]|uniref:CHAT domain-containing protein n=1 Tax=Zopfia rhizophila CBS 207.26 TaxID=1314779 RepID=A0A6A6EVG7_9PEZI|nr:hypothetical protein K469DRAFT_689149 [Zopfia rhizophila CBS 207.26]